MPHEKSFSFPSIYILTASLLLAGCYDIERREIPKNVFRIKPKTVIKSPYILVESTSYKTYIVDRFEKDGELVYDSSRRNESQRIVRPDIWQDCFISWGLRIKNTPRVYWLIKQRQGNTQFTIPDPKRDKDGEKVSKFIYKLKRRIREKQEQVTTLKLKQKIDPHDIKIQIVAELLLSDTYIIRSSYDLGPEATSQVLGATLYKRLYKVCDTKNIFNLQNAAKCMPSKRPIKQLNILSRKAKLLKYVK